MLTEMMLYFHSLLLRRPDPLLDKIKDMEEWVVWIAWVTSLEHLCVILSKKSLKAHGNAYIPLRSLFLLPKET